MGEEAERRPYAADGGRAAVAPAFAATARTPADGAWSEALQGAKQQQKRAADDGGSASAGEERGSAAATAARAGAPR